MHQNNSLLCVTAGMSSSFADCKRTYRFFWFTFAFVLATLLGLLVASFMNAALIRRCVHLFETGIKPIVQWFGYQNYCEHCWQTIPALNIKLEIVVVPAWAMMSLLLLPCDEPIIV